MTVNELFLGLNVSFPSGLGSGVIKGITYNSREVQKGFLFVAIKGFASDGHRYIQDAISAGASAVVTEREVPELDSSKIIVNRTGDNRELLSKVSAIFYEFPWEKLQTVGITGTNGKTSTAHMLRWILENNSISCGVMGTVGHIAGGRAIQASVTTPDSSDISKYMREMVDNGDTACVMEVSSHALALDRVNSVRFDITLFTNISQDHLDFHDSMKDYLNTKIKLFSLMKPGGRCIIGTYAPDYPKVKNALFFGEQVNDTYSISDMQVNLTGSEFTLQIANQSFSVTLVTPGRFNIYNATGAIIAAIQLGIPIEQAIEAIASFPGVPGRMESINCSQNFLVAVDYAHTPDALERVLKQGASLAENRLIAVFGCGGDRDNKKRPIMGRIAAENADLVFVTSDNPRTENPANIIDEIIAGIPTDSFYFVEADRRKAIKNAINEARAGDVVIIAGKGHENYQILGVEKIHFDDREEAENALKNRGYLCAL